MAVNYELNPAVFDKEVVLLEEHIVTSEFGTPRSYWHPVARAKASIEPISGREYWTASQSQGEASVRIIIRYRDGVNSRMRVLYKSRDGDVVFEMKSPPINKLEANGYLELMCRELINNGAEE